MDFAVECFMECLVFKNGNKYYQVLFLDKRNEKKKQCGLVIRYSYRTDKIPINSTAISSASVMTYLPTVFPTLSHLIDLINFYSRSDYTNPAICIPFLFKSMRRLRKVIYQDMFFIFGCCSDPADWKVFGLWK